MRRAVNRLAEPHLLFPLVGVLLLGVVWGTTLNLIQVEKGIATRAAASSSVELADTYEAQVVRALREIDQALKLVKFTRESTGRNPSLEELKGKGLLPPDLLFVVTLTEADGTVAASTRSLGKASLADEPFFLRLALRDTVVVSRPEADPRDNESKLRFARRLERPDGSFAGAVIVTVPAAYFVSGYEAAKLGNKGVLALIGVDGVIRARRTGEVVAHGETADYAQLVASPSDGNAQAVPNPWDQVPRFTVTREIFDFPLAVVVGLSEAEQMAPVTQRAHTYVWRAAAGSLVLALILAALWRLGAELARTRQEAHLTLQEEIRVRRGAEAALNLRNRAIESSVNAIVIIDVGRSGNPIEYVNPAFEQMTGYAAREALGRDGYFLLGEDLEQPGLAEIEHAIRERRDGHAVLRNYRKDGSVFWDDFHIAPVRNESGEVTHFVGVMNDVTEAKQYEAQLAMQANFDSLTGLANRNLLQDRLQQAIVVARREGRKVATVFLDIDHFKLVNDTLGHRVGDELLQQVAGRLKSCVRESDTVARLGGDEFVLVLNARPEGEAGTLESDLTAIMNKLLVNVSVPLSLGGRQIRPSCSIGVSIFPQDGENADMLLRNADAAMYRAKELGRNRFQLFTADVHERIRRRMELESSLRLALEREEFVVHYQPQVGLRDGRIMAFEALVRWRHPEKGLVGPAQFIPFAEETGLIVPLGAWVLREACRQNKAWQDAGLPKLPVSVNMSAKQCEQEDIVEVVKEALAAAKLEARYLELEITESISMANPEQSVPLMQRLKATGVGLSIDDFGTGFSNLSYLPRFPVDRLKIDLAFVRQMAIDPGSLAVSEAIINMSHSLHLEVVAEGVENDVQLQLLGSRHCDSIQGYLFSPAVAAAELATLLKEDRRLPYIPAARLQPAPNLIM
ncbi:MAG TPA: EAL domain-containing protein [Usitatibacter sp.]|nr:EAL domain-containing protein [Usitatibacter sp.]